MKTEDKVEARTEEKAEERAEEKDRQPSDYKVEDRRSNRPSSTAEVARNLERDETERRSDNGEAALFQDNESKEFRGRWKEIQTAFVDEPRRAVEQADALVAEVIQRLANSFSSARTTLEGQWGRGDNVSTEDLRVTLQRYRAFFDRLLNV